MTQAIEHLKVTNGIVVAASVGHMPVFFGIDQDDQLVMPIPGPAGSAGATGAQGIQGLPGPAIFLEPDQGEQGMPIPGPITLTGDVTGSGTGSFAATIAANAVTNVAIRDGGACSVIGRSANSSGDPADIAAGANGQYLGRTANALGFGYVPGQCIYNNLIVADESTTSTSYTNLTTLDSASVTLDAQHDLLILYLAYSYQGTALKSAFSEVFLDGTGQTNSELAQTHPNAGYAIAHYIAFVITAVSAGAHTIAIRHKCDAGTAHWLSRQFLISSVG